MIRGMIRGILSWKLRYKVTAGAVVVLFGGLGFGAFRLASSAAAIPTAEVQRKDFLDTLEIKGEIKALRSMVLMAPYSAGDLQIVSVVDNSAKVKKGDLLVQFDTTSIQQKLAQDKSAVKSAEAEIDQSQAGARLKEEQDLTDVMNAKYDAEKARMDASKQEILSAIDGEQAKLKVVDAEETLKAAEAKLKADRLSAAADLASKKEKLKQTEFQMHQDESSLESLALRAPLDGVVALQSHWQPQGPAPFKQGDRAWPGAAIVELPDPTSLKISARVEEAERGQLKVNQAAEIHVDAVPDRTFAGRVEAISPTASLDFNAGWPIPRNFSVDVTLPEKDARLTPGMGATIRVGVAKIPDGLVIPASAVFRKAGRAVAYVQHGSKFEETPVEVSRRNTEVVLLARGLQPGERVALKDPTLPR
ncbi:MAG TPA: efflux RND transporter periplasmic adaptor subunit [Candidatus Acidoferrum sp.]|nr:efflux RND transporter periplasmic adaptor subunit [Candidatus Acidoferrum sp.]